MDDTDPPIESGSAPVRSPEVDEFPEKDEEDRDLIRLALHKSPFFTCLDEEQIERFIKAAELKTYEAGQSVILEGCVDGIDVEDEGSHPSHERGETSTESEAQLVENNHKEKEDHTTEEGFVLIENPGNTNQVWDSRESGAFAQTQDSGARDDLPPDNQELCEQSEVGQPSPMTANTKRQDDPSSSHYLEPPPPKSGVPSYIYIIRDGQADVVYSQNVNPASLGAGTLFGEGGFLFGRQHSASVLATSETLECFVVEANTFRSYVLPSENMTKLYQKHATHLDENDNEPYMTMKDFVNSCLDQQNPTPALTEDENAETPPSNNPATIKDPLAGVRLANTFNILRNKTLGATTFSQRISLADFCIFHLLMARPDPEVDITFLLMDERKRGVIFKEDLANFLKSSVDDFKFDMESDFIQRHFGKSKTFQRGIRPHQFSQFLVDLRKEVGQQVFLQEMGKNGTTEGYLSASRFVQVLQKGCGWGLPDGVVNRLENIYGSHLGLETKESNASTLTRVNKRNGLPSIHKQNEVLQATPSMEVSANERRRGEQYFSYCDFLAFQEVLGQLPGICSLIDRACEIKKGPVSADDFKVANRVLGMGGRMSRRQVDIIFQLFDLDGDGYVSHADTVAVAGAEITQRIDAVPGRQGSLTFAPPPTFRDDAEKLPEQYDNFWGLLENFSLTSIAGALGVVALAPLDLVKTRLMNERASIKGQRMYKNSYDCLQLAMRTEGPFALYRGLLPQLIAIAPEKAIKLAVNDLLQHSLVSKEDGTHKTGLHYLEEMLAGGCAGACQLLVTNPIEIVKIRMQLEGETARLLKARGFESTGPQSLTAVASRLGYSGLFTGARACLLRDIPFGAIYFPTYYFCKENLSSGEGPARSISAANLLVAGTLAGVPASFLTTPADVIKTRLQVVPRPGEVRYDGIRDCFAKIWEREGPATFFRGSAMRVARISPQFGISLVAYEQLSRLLGAQGLLSPTEVRVDPKDYWGAFPARAINNKTNDTDLLLKNLGSDSLRPSGPWQGQG